MLLCSLACSLLASPPAADPGPRVMPDIVRRFDRDRRDLERFYDVPLSTRRIARLREFFEDEESALGEIDFESLGQDDRVDCVLLQNEIRAARANLDLEERRRAETTGLLPFAPDLVALEERRRAMEEEDPREVAGLLAARTEEVRAVRNELAERLRVGGGPKPTVARRAADALAAVRRMARHWFEFRDGYDPEFSWWCRKPFSELEEELRGYERELKRDAAGMKGQPDDPLIGDPVGRDALLDLLDREMIPYSPEELVACAEREFAYCEAEYRKAAAELGFGDDWRAALEHVKELHVPPGRQDDLIERLAREAIAYLDRHDLVTVPPLCRETWRIEMMSEERQKQAPFFLYGGQHILVSYPTDAMSHAEKLMSMRANNIHFSRATVQHELIPGHHLQGFVAARHNTHRAPFRTAFLGEGWCLHWEMLLYENGFPSTPEDRIGMLFWRSHRCARIIVSLGFHLETMTTQEMIDFLVDRVGHERDSATAEVRRYVGGDYGPLYQCAYLIGGLQIRALYDELVRGGRMDARAFHDAVLRQGSIPVEMIRAALTGAPLRRDDRASWRFLD